MGAASQAQKMWLHLRGNSTAWGLSLIIHGVILLILAMFTWAVAQPEPPDRVLTLSEVIDAPVETFDGRAVGDDTPVGPPRKSTAAFAAARAAVTPPAPPQPTALAAAMTTLLVKAQPAPAAPMDDGMGELMRSLGTGGGLGSGGVGGLGLGVSAGFGREIQGLRKRGLDIVLLLDATGSMDSTIDDARRRLTDVIDVVSFLVPDARFGIVTYKDHGDDYGAKAIRTRALTSDSEAVHRFLGGVRTSGGGDLPEAIAEAMAAAVNPRTLGWRQGAMRVIILVCDAPMHEQDRPRTLQLARRFSRKFGGRINVIDVGRNRSVLPQLKEIASYGGGASFSLAQGDQFWRHLVVSVFGRKYTTDVHAVIDQVTGE